ncbi:MAG TPA: hypothetical protein VM662_02215 [Sphingomonas sp.]|nr:hypothetical protein [Sphingomonas sp.]
MFRSILLATALITYAAIPAVAAARQQGAAAKPNAVKPRPDLADAVAGTYFGDVASDARGSSRAGVTITVTKVGANTVRIDSDYARLPSVTTRLERVANTIQKAGTGAGKLDVFLLETSASPQKLSLTIDDASWYGEKRN